MLPTPCATHWEVNTDRGYTWSFKHLRRHCFQSWFLNYDSLSNANLCYERLVAGSKVLSSSTKTKHEPSQPGKRLLTRPDHSSTQILCERYPQPLERFLFGNFYKLLILLLHGTQSGYLRAGAKPESSVKADINRYSNWDFYSFSFSFTAARIPLQIDYPRVIFFLKTVSEKVRLFLHVLSMSWWIWIEQVRQPNYAWDVKWKSTCKPYLTLSKRP